MSWVIYALITAASLATHQICFKLTSQYFHPIWASLLYVPLMILFLAPFAANLYMAGDKPVITLQSAGLLAALAASGTVFVVLYLKTFQLAPEASMVLVVVDAGAVITSVLLASWLFGESMSLTRIAGIAMAVTGIVLALKG